MKSNKIQKWSLSYCLFRFYVIFIHKLYYKEIIVLGRENLPKTGPVILSPNHQNALMDALAIACTVPRQTVFLARADIFRKPLFARVLAFFKIMPVYRMRDGYANLAKNEECFAQAVTILNEGGSICLMPEGNHGGQRRLRPFSKGIFRIALRAQEAKGTTPFVNIVPVGLDYSDYSRFRARLIIRFGAPIDVSTYFHSYRNQPGRAFYDLCSHLRNEMMRIMLHVESAAHYETIWALKEIYRDRMFRKLHRDSKNVVAMFAVDRKLLELLDERVARGETRMAQIEPKVDLYARLLRELRLQPADLDDEESRTSVLAQRGALYLCALPVLVYGCVNNIISFVVSARMATSLEDPQFRSSLKFVSGVFLVPVISLLQTLLLFWYCRSFAICGVYLVSLYLTGTIGFDLYAAATEYVSALRYLWALHCEKGQYLELRRTHAGIVDFLDALTRESCAIA
jgi:1-acyl-sn-glycerol-3-phosphate acyltransferase